jgi:CubicO group peptidase (beta-lactamase class C family)
VIVGYLIEKLTGKSCDQYVADNILRPLGMMHSDTVLTPAIKSALARGYEGNPPRPVPYLPMLAPPAGQMMSSPAEKARFMRMMLNRGELDGVRIVGADSITRMEAPTESVGARAGLKIGFGIAT